jgi:Na+/H+-dicarboxylate symporter
MLFKDLLMTFIPFVVWGYLMSALVSFDKRSLKMILGIVCLTSLAGFFTILLGYEVSVLSFPFMNFKIFDSTVAESVSHLSVLWSLPIKSPLTPSRAILIALALGLLATFFNITLLKRFAVALRDRSTSVLNRYFIPCLWIYVFGVFIKLQYEGTVGFLFQGYGKVFLLIYGTIFCILLLTLMIAARFSITRFKSILRDLGPASMTVLTTMSSIASLPFLVRGLEKIMGSKRYPNFVAPLTVNFHTLGSGFAIVITSLALLSMANLPFPGFSQVLVFSGYYCLARFFNACVPGGGILVMRPFVEEYLGLPAAQCDLLVTLYVLQDSLISFSNVMGNASFALLTRPLFDRPLHRKDKKTIDTVSSSTPSIELTQESKGSR